MSKQITILSGSPRKNMNTDRLVQSFTDGAKQSGNSIFIHKVADLNIGGCRGCNHCFKHDGVCVQKDDMSTVLDDVKRSNLIAFASPVYFFGVTAQLKAAIDRMYALLPMKTAIEGAVFLVTCGNVSSAAAVASAAMYHQICSYMKWNDLGVIVAQFLHNQGEIEGRRELEEAFDLGRSVI